MKKIFKTVIGIVSVGIISFVVFVIYNIQTADTLYANTKINYDYRSTAVKKKILIVATSSDHRINKPDKHDMGCYVPEISLFYGVMYQHGYRLSDIDIISPKGGVIPTVGNLQFSKHNPVPDEEREKLQQKINTTLLPTAVNADDYNVIYYAGGMTCLVDFPENKDIAALASKIYESGGIVAAVCDGISGLLPIKTGNKYLVDNVKVTTNAYAKNSRMNVTNEMKKRNGIVVSSPIVSDQRVITGRGVRPQTVASEILLLLGGKID